MTLKPLDFDEYLSYGALWCSLETSDVIREKYDKGEEDTSIIILVRVPKKVLHGSGSRHPETD